MPGTRICSQSAEIGNEVGGVKVTGIDHKQVVVKTREKLDGFLSLLVELAN